MNGEDVVLLCMGLAFGLNGFFLTTRRGYAEWGLRVGRARIWVRMLGQERAVKLTMRGFGPALIALGVVILLMVGVDVTHGHSLAAQGHSPEVSGHP